MATEKVAKSRVFTIMQYEKNSKTGEDLGFGEDNILSGIEYKSIKQYAYILHDKDMRTDDEFEAYVEKTGEEPEWRVGDVKPRHWHVVISVSPALSVAQVAKWFNVNPNFIEMVKGRNAFIDCVEYLTHESEKQQVLGKYRYPDEEVKANFEFRERLDQRAKDRAKYGRDLSEKDRYRYQVLYEGKRISEIINENPLAYQNDFATLDRLRMKYITETAKMPLARLNYYIYAEDGKNGSGIGKGLLSKALARSMYPNIENDNEIFFQVGADGSAFEGYDGQPVLIWDDRRGAQLLKELGGVGNVYNVFDTNPSNQRQNVKYGSVKLINEVNIVNSVQDVKEFLSGISGADSSLVVEDQNQARRRFPFIIPMRYDDFDVLINKGFMNNTNEFDQYIKYANIRANMQRIQIAGAGRADLIQQAEAQLLEPVVDKHNEFIERAQFKEAEITIDSILQGTSSTVIEEEEKDKGECKYPYTMICQKCGKEHYGLSADPNLEGQTVYEFWCDDCFEMPF